MDSPWDEHPESTNTLQELEWTKMSSEFTNVIFISLYLFFFPFSFTLD
jgi:hypothetical protein